MFLVVFSTILYLILVEREPFQLTCALQETEKVACPHFGNPSRRKVINYVRLKPKEVKATAEERKEEYMVEAENSALWRLGFASIKVLPGPSRIFSGLPLLAIASSVNPTSIRIGRRHECVGHRRSRPLDLFGWCLSHISVQHSRHMTKLVADKHDTIPQSRLAQDLQASP